MRDTGGVETLAADSLRISGMVAAETTSSGIADGIEPVTLTSCTTRSPAPAGQLDLAQGADTPRGEGLTPPNAIAGGKLASTGREQINANLRVCWPARAGCGDL